MVISKQILNLKIINLFKKKKKWINSNKKNQMVQVKIINSLKF
jgi:hypothetical protein